MVAESQGSPSRASARCVEPPSASLLRGIQQFNQRLFFEQHETLEDAWIEEADPIRYLYQGILQVGVGLYHLRRGNYRGALSLLDRGMGYLSPFSPSCMGVDVGRLLAETGRVRAELAQLGAERFSDLDDRFIPAVHLLEPSADG